MSNLAYLSGRLLPASESAVPIHDAGLVSGATVTDFCRTFGRRLFRWPDHLARFRRDCSTCFIPLTHTDDELTAIAERLVEHNSALLPEGGELALVTFATPGPIGSYVGAPGEDGPPTLVMHTFPLAFERYRRFFTEGVVLAVAGRHAVADNDLLPAHVKHRSRLHWWRAEHLLRQRADVPSGALALACDGAGHLTETAIGNLLVVIDGVVTTPPVGSVLDGISLLVVRELCDEMKIAFAERELTLDDVSRASESMLCGTAFCVAGVRWIEGRTLVWPGPVTTRLLTKWGERVGVDIAGQFTATGADQDR
jgi:branched-subunit amino acid aminotransferase/4-amino-4-deoxychorismate lyase